MNFKEFKSSFYEFFNSKNGYENHKCIAYIRDDETGDGLIAAHCTQEEAMQMIFVIARKCGITLKELAFMCIAIDSDKDASKALDDIVKSSDKSEKIKKAIASVEEAKATLEADKNGDESQKNESQKSKESDDGDFDKDEIADVISSVLMDVLKSLDD